VTTADIDVDRPQTARIPRSVWEARYVARLAPVDALVGLSATVAALLLRSGPNEGESSRTYLWLTVLLPAAWLVALLFGRAYETRNLFVGNDEYQRVVRAGLALTAAIAVVLYAFDIAVARDYLLVAMPMMVALGVVTRYLMRGRLHKAWARGECRRRVVVVGHATGVAELTRRLEREPYHGMTVVAACLPAGANHSEIDIPICGSFDEVATTAWRADADTVMVLSCPELDGQVVRRLAWQLELDDIDLIMASALIDVADERTTLRPVDGLPLLHVDHPRLHGVRRIVKSVTDRCAAGAALLVLGPLLLVIAAAVRWQPGGAGPALARQRGVGRSGRRFTIYKFRARRADAQITPLGRWLRRYSLEGLPRLINVLRGDMSLVGPPPRLLDELALTADVLRRLVVKPGLTGLSRIAGGGDLPWEEAVRLDLRYVENWSLTLDLVIVLRTITAAVRSSTA